MVTRLDLSSLVEQATAALNENPERYGQTPPAEGERLVADINRDLGMIETDEGVFVLCTEGVGSEHPLTETDGVQLDVYAKTYRADDTGYSFGMFPFASTTLSLDRVRECATGPVEPLESFIRVFGSRLEGNFRLWVERLHRTEVEA